MIGGGFSGLSREWAMVRILALIGLAYLFYVLFADSRTIDSNWRGGSPGTALMGASNGLSGEAAAQNPNAPGDPDLPWGNPLRVPNTVMTQGYGVGSHAPAETWGAVDLAVDGNGDGEADPKGTMGVPVYATHRGTIQMATNTWPAGNHIWVTGERYKTGYAHLKGFVPGIKDGQVVERGQIIGYVGSTGQSSGPHLDYQVWKDGVNVNPLGYTIFNK